MLSPETIADLTQTELFSKLGEHEEICFEDAEEVALAVGARLFETGQPVGYFFVMVRGAFRVLRIYGEQEVLMATGGPGSFVGEISLLLDIPSPADCVISATARVVRFDRPAFFKLLRTCEPAAGRILRAMAARVRGAEAFSASREKLASLGTMAAGMAHELNNPLAAARRAMASLGDAVKRWRELSLEISRDGFSGGCWQHALQIEHETVYAARAAGRTKLDPLAQSDREEELAAWMEGRGVEDAWKLSPGFVAAGLDVAWLEKLAAPLPANMLSSILPWLEAGLTVDLLRRDAEESTARASELVGAIKRYSHVDRSPRQNVDLHESLETTLKMLAFKLRGIEVVREFAESLPPITGYPGELNQVWTNLIANAAEALEGKGMLRVSTGRDGPDHVIVTVADNGSGIPPEVIPRLFEPFFTTKDVGNGTGLGLTISHRIIADRHGGEIEVESKPGDTRFVIRLPLVAPNDRHAPAAVVDTQAIP